MPSFRNPRPLIAASLESAGNAPEFLLVDVGCSGGIAPEWAGYRFVRAIGFDPLIAEIDRLKFGASSRHVFEAAYVTGPDGPSNRVDSWFGRASFWKAHAALRRDYVRDVQNAGAAVVYADRRVSLDEYFAAEQRRVNFIKTDTDGQDIAVLRGAKATLTSAVGVVCEANFHAFAPHSTVWRDIDGFLNSLGFYLADLDLHRYTRAALPGRFRASDLSDTETGAVAWANCLYLRDAVTLEGEDLLRLAIAADIYNLQDVAAEALLQFGAKNASCMARSVPLLDELARTSGGAEASDYRSLIQAFDEDPKSFYRPPEPASPTGPWPRRVLQRLIGRGRS